MLQLSDNSPKQQKTYDGIICLPFVNELECFTKNFFKKLNINFVFSTINKLNNVIVLGKDREEKYNKNNVVYKINCKNCEATYVGQTGRRLNIRIKEHRKKYLDKDDKSSIFAHPENNNHTIDFDNIKILDTEINNGKRLFSEAFFIHQQKII